MSEKTLILVLDNIRSAHNVGTILRTCDGAGVAEVITCGITPYPSIANDPRPGYVTARAEALIAKTALGAEKTIKITHFTNLENATIELKSRGIVVYGLENRLPATKDIFYFRPQFPCALVLGNEVQGISQPELLDALLEIPMSGGKHSLNVSVAAGIALYQFMNSAI